MPSAVSVSVCLFVARVCVALVPAFAFVCGCVFPFVCVGVCGSGCLGVCVCGWVWVLAFRFDF